MKRSVLVRLGIFIVIALVAALMEWGTLTGPHVGSTDTYHAMFGGSDGVSGLRTGNTVRVSGVPVGKVTGITLHDATHAEVTFTANDRQTLTTDTYAVVRYANLLGQRFLALTDSGSAPGTPLRPGAMIPQSHTAPALSLTLLFNGFRPLFAALTPSQVNDLSGEIIDALQGQTATIDDLVAKTADLTANLADRGKTFSTVLDSLSSLLGTVAAHDNELGSAVTELHNLTTQLQADGPGILDSLSGIDGLIGSVGGSLQQLENHNLPADISDAASVTGVLAKNTSTLNNLISGFVTAFTDFDRVTQNGNWINAYPCNVSVITYGTVSITAADLVNAITDTVPGSLGALLAKLGLGTQTLAALALPTPLKLPNGVVGNTTAHTAVCK